MKRKDAPVRRKRDYFVKAILFSVLLHLGFVFISGLIHIGRISMEFVNTQEFFKVKSADPKYFEPMRHTNDKEEKTQKTFNPVDSSKTVDYLEESLKENFKENKTRPKVADSLTPDASSLQDKNKSPKEFEEMEKKLTPVQVTEKKIVPKSVTVMNADALKSKTTETASPDALFDTTNNEEALQMAGFAPAYHGLSDDKDSWQSLHPFTKSNSALSNTSLGLEDINEHLVCELLTYTDPSDGQKYFQIRVRAGKKVEELKRIPREVVFLVDSSLSIQPERLKEFKKGLSYALSKMDPQDTFNIRVFKEDVRSLSEKSLAPTEDNIKRAVAFVEQIHSGEGTDTYGAFFESIRASNDRNPSYLFLLSDGKPTLGELDSTKIIREISRVNNGKKGIFAFSGGSRVNRYLLDFISYRNRGWSEYASKTHQINAYLIQMLDKIRDPILLNMRYNLSGVDLKETYPKILPDFFRNAEVNIYGKYSKEDRIILRFLANRDGKTHELEVETTFDQALSGDETIMKNWAYNKIYDLVGRMDDSAGFSDLLWSVQEISRKFGIETPYTKGNRD